jgi:hypothetical protein
MALDVYFRRDIANILRATACASEGAAGLALELLGDAELGDAGISQERLLQVYRQGVRHALVSVGLAFGLEPVGLAGIGTPPRPGVSPPLAGLLWAEAPSEP